MDEEDIILLYKEYTPQNPPIRHTADEKFSLVNNDPAECKEDFLYLLRPYEFLQSLHVTME